jgi:signal peptidase II
MTAVNKWALAGSISGGLVTLDQITKLAVLNWLAPLRRVEVIPGVFDLTFVMNTGVAFGFLSGERSLTRVMLLLGFALTALGIIIYFIHTARENEWLFIVSLAFIAGGAAGNAIDRFRLHAVVDFLDFYFKNYHWPAFNVADIGITVGTALILLHLWRTRGEP